MDEPTEISETLLAHDVPTPYDTCPTWRDAMRELVHAEDAADAEDTCETRQRQHKAELTMKHAEDKFGISVYFKGRDDGYTEKTRGLPVPM